MDIWQSFPFWAGLVYFTFPFNYFIYSWNDWADMEIDALNPRKNTYLFGAVAVEGLKRQVIWVNVLTQLPFWLFFAWHTGWYFLWWSVTLLFLNFIYNDKQVKLSGKPPWEIFVSLGYLLAFVMSIRLNNVYGMPFLTYVYLSLFAVQSHLIGEVMDIEPDRQGGRRTTGTVLGYRNTKLLLVIVIGIEAFLLLWRFDELLLGGFLALYALYLIIDSLFIWKNTPYPVKMLKFFGICANIAALATMVWLWITGSLVI